MIPKVIHCCWFGRSLLPDNVKNTLYLGKNCPKYGIKRWYESNFDIDCLPSIKAAYTEKTWAFVSDCACLKVVYENGGTYVDTDGSALQTLLFVRF